jgi:hypothetical protein
MEYEKPPIISANDFSACGEHLLSLAVISGSILKVPGTSLDHITGKGSSSSQVLPVKELLEQQREWKLLGGLSYDISQYIAGDKASDAYWRTLISIIQDLPTRHRSYNNVAVISKNT